MYVLIRTQESLRQHSTELVELLTPKELQRERSGLLSGNYWYRQTLLGASKNSSSSDSDRKKPQLRSERGEGQVGVSVPT